MENVNILIKYMKDVGQTIQNIPFLKMKLFLKVGNESWKFETNHESLKQILKARFDFGSNDDWW